MIIKLLNKNHFPQYYNNGKHKKNKVIFAICILFAYYCCQRLSFLPELEDLGYKEHFNYIIYGHTHRRWPRTFFRRRIKPLYQQPELFKIKDAFLFNTGAWQHVDYPSFIQIDNDWNINLVDIKTKIRKVEVILEKPPSQRLERETLKRQQQIQSQQEIQKKQGIELKLKEE